MSGDCAREHLSAGRYLRDEYGQQAFYAVPSYLNTAVDDRHREADPQSIACGPKLPHYPLAAKPKKTEP